MCAARFGGRMTPLLNASVFAAACFWSIAAESACTISTSARAAAFEYTKISGRSTVPQSTAYDPSTGYTWQRCSLGQTWNGRACAGTPGVYSMLVAKRLVAAVGGGWRLPTNAELVSLLRGNCEKPATDDGAFPGVASDRYWTSDLNGPLGAFYVDFSAYGANGAETADATALASVLLVK